MYKLQRKLAKRLELFFSLFGIARILSNKSLSASPRFNQNSLMASKPNSERLSGIKLTAIETSQVLHPLCNITNKIQNDHALTITEVQLLITDIICKNPKFNLTLNKQRINLGTHILQALDELVQMTPKNQNLCPKPISEIKSTLEKNCKVSLNQWLKGNKTKKLSYEKLVIALSSLAQRPTIQFQVNEKSYFQISASARVRSADSSVSLALSFSEGLTPSSEAEQFSEQLPNHDMLDQRNCNAAIVKSSNQHLVTRTAKSDTSSKIEELLALSARSNLTIDHSGKIIGKGLLNKNRLAIHPVYQLVISASFSIKWFTNWLRETSENTDKPQAFITSRHEGLTYLKICESIDEIFGSDRIIVRNVEIKDTYGNTRVVPLRFAKPLTTNFTFKTEGKNALAPKKNRKNNKLILRKLFPLLQHQWSNIPKLAKLTQLLSTLDQNPDNIQLVQDEYSLLRKENKLTIQQIAAVNYITLCEADCSLEVNPETNENYSFETKEATISEFILLRGLLEEIGVAHSVQCENGEEQTTTMVAILVAADALIFNHQPTQQTPNPENSKPLEQALQHMLSPNTSEGFKAALNIGNQALNFNAHASIIGDSSTRLQAPAVNRKA